MPESWGLSLTVGITLLLIFVGAGSAALSYQWNQSCHEKWDNVQEADVECEDFLYVGMFYGGSLSVLTGLVALGTVAWRRRTTDEPTR